MSERLDSNSQRQPSDWDACTVRLSITFLPTEQGGRRVILGCNTQQEPPIIETVDEKDLGEWPLLVTALLNQLKQRFLERATLAAAQQQAEIAAQQKVDESLPSQPIVAPAQQEGMCDVVAMAVASISEAMPTTPSHRKQPSLFG